MITLVNSTLFYQLNELLNDPLVYKGNHKFDIEEIGVNWLWLFDPQKDQSGLQQQGLTDIDAFKNSKTKELMPHFVIDCSNKILEIKSPQEIIEAVHNTAASTDLFDEGDIKVRIKTYEHYSVANTSDDFIHVFANIMEGRNTTKKRHLSKLVVSQLNNMFPKVPVISMNIRDFEKASYCNKWMI